MSYTEREAGLPARPSLDDVAERVGSKEWLAALALLRLSPAVAADAAQWASWDERSGRYTADDPDDPLARTFHPNAAMDWAGWVADVDTVGRGWSSSEHRLFALAAALVVEGRTVPLRGVLDQLGSWEIDVLDVLVQWATGGNNREFPGRSRVIASRELGELLDHRSTDVDGAIDNDGATGHSGGGPGDPGSNSEAGDGRGSG